MLYNFNINVYIYTVIPTLIRWKIKIAIIFIDAKKAVDKIKHTFMIKTHECYKECNSI